MYNVINTQKLNVGRFTVHVDTVEKSGKEYMYSYIESSDSVGVLAEKDSKYVFIKQYRHSIKDYVLEIPGGAIDKKIETIENVAKRELEEETGFNVLSIERLGDFYPSVGSSKEICHLFRVVCGERNAQNLDPLEYIEVILLDKGEVEEKIVQGAIMQSMALVAWSIHQRKSQCSSKN